MALFGKPKKEISKKEEKETKKEEKKENWLEQEGELAVDAYQTDEEIVVQSTIAGIDPEDLDISLENEILTIRGKRTKPKDAKVPEENDKHYFYQECYWGAFSREIMLPEEADPGNVEASIEKGVLTIRIPKLQKTKKRKIKVKRQE